MGSDTLTLKFDADTQSALQKILALNRSVDDTEKKAKGAIAALNDFGRGALQNYQNIHALVGDVGRLVSGMIDAAAAEERHQRALASLGSAYAQVQAATRGAVTAEEAMRAQQQLSQAGFHLTSESLAAVTRKAREYSIATGTDLPQALDQLTQALINGEAGGLRRFGLTADHNNNRVRTLTGAIAQLRHEQEQAAPAAQTLAEQTEQAGHSWEHFTGALAAAISSFGPVNYYITQTTELLRGLAGELRQMEEANRHGNEQNDVAGGTRERLIRSIQHAQARGLNVPNLYGGTNSILGGGAHRSVGEEAALATLLDRAGSDEDVQRALGGVDRVRDERRRSEAAANASPFTQPPPRTASGSSGGSHEDFRDQLAQIDEIRSRLGMLEQIPFEVHRRIGEATSSFLQRELSTWEEQLQHASEQATARANKITETLEQAKRKQQEIADFNKAADRARRDKETTQGRESLDHERDLTRQMDDQDFAVREANDAGHQLAREFTTNAAVTGTAAQQLARTVSSSFNTMTGAISSHIRALAEGRETAGQALKGMLTDVLFSIGQEATVKSLMFFAKAAGDAAGTATVGLVPGDLAAGAAFAGVAAAAFGGGAAIASTGNATSQTAASTTASGSPRAIPSGSETSANAPGGGTTIINYTVNGSVMSDQASQDHVVHLLNRARQRGAIPAGLFR